MSLEEILYTNDDEPAQLILEVTPKMEELIKEALNIELEMMQGTRKKLPGGLTKITMHITDPEKIEHIRAFILQMISGSNTKNLN